MKVRSFLERKEFIRWRGGRRQGNRVKGTKLPDLCVWNWIVCSSPDSSQQHRYLSVAALHHQPLELWIHVQNSRNLVVASYRCMHPTERGNRSLQSLGPGSATPCLFAVKTMQGSKWPATEKMTNNDAFYNGFCSVSKLELRVDALACTQLFSLHLTSLIWDCYCENNRVPILCTGWSHDKILQCIANLTSQKWWMRRRMFMTQWRPRKIPA